MEKELTNIQIAKIDKLHNISYEAMAEVLGYQPRWNIEWIGEIADVLTKIAVNIFGEDEMDIYP